MKKIIVCLLVLFSCIGAMSQPVTPRSSQTITVSDARWMAVFNMFAPRYLDTTQANLSIGIDSSSGIIYTYNSNSIWFRQSNPKKWTPIGSSNNNGGGDTLFAQLPAFFDSITRHPNTILKILRGNGIISGGTVTVDSCRTLDVVPTIISMNYKEYSNPSSTVLTVPASNPSNPRTDLVIMDTLGVISLLPGTPSISALPPSINAASQFILASYTIAAGASCLSISQVIVWDENLGSPDEFVLSTSGTISANGNSTAQPFHLTKAIFINTYTDGSSLIFTSSSPLTAQANEVFKFWTFVNGNFANQFQVQFYNGSTPVGIPVSFNTGFGFNPNDSNQYQQVVIPFSALNITSQTFDKVVITFAGDDVSGAKGLYIDYVQLQQGNNNAGVPIILTTIGSSGPATYNPITGVLNIPVYSGGSGGERFGIEDNLGIQNRAIDMQQKNLDINNIDNFSINESNNVNFGTFSMDSVKSLIVNNDDTSESFLRVTVDDIYPEKTHAELSSSITDNAINYAQQILVSPKFISLSGSVGSEPRSKVVFEHTDTLLTTPTYVYVPDGDTLKVYPFSGGGGGNTIYTANDNIVSERTVGLNGNRLRFRDGSDDYLILNPTVFQSSLGATDGTAFSVYSNNADLSGNTVSFDFISSDGANTVEITGNPQANTIDYTAGTHTLISTGANSAGLIIANDIIHGIMVSPSTSQSVDFVINPSSGGIGARTDVTTAPSASGAGFDINGTQGGTDISSTAITLDAIYGNFAGDTANKHQILIYPNVIKFNSNGSVLNGDSLNTKVVFERLDELLTTPEFMAVWDGDTLKKFAFTTGGTTADNGLTLTGGNNVQLGGTLLDNTSIQTGGFTLSIDGTTENPVFTANTTTGAAIFGVATGSGIGVSGQSTTGPGATFQSDEGIPLIAIGNTAATNTVTNVLRLVKNTATTPTSGIGGSLIFDIITDIGGSAVANSLISKLTDVTDATPTSEFSITGINSGSINTLLVISGAGIFTLAQSLPVYVNNAAAILGGLTVNQLYRISVAGTSTVAIVQ